MWTYRIFGLLAGPSPARTVEASTWRAAQDWIVGEIVATIEAPQIWHVVIDDPRGARLRFDVDRTGEGGIHVSRPWS